MKTQITYHEENGYCESTLPYIDASGYLVMAVVREAYEKGLHLKNVDYCCPPVVMVFEE